MMGKILLNNQLIVLNEQLFKYELIDNGMIFYAIIICLAIIALGILLYYIFKDDKIEDYKNSEKKK